MQTINSLKDNTLQIIQDGLKQAVDDKKFELLPEYMRLFLDALEKISSDDQLLTVEEAAEFLHIKPSTVRKKCSARQIPYIDIGPVRFRKVDLMKWLQSHKVEPHRVWR